MNRRKKMTQIFKKKEKKKSAKLHCAKKPIYISKAEQAMLAAKKDSAEHTNEHSPTPTK
jgi:hypothetical protein